MWQTLLNFFFYSIAAIAAENVLFARALGLSYLGGQPRRIADTLLFGGVFTGMTVLSSGITWAVSNMLGSRPYLNYLRPTAFFAVICLIYLACYFVFGKLGRPRLLEIRRLLGTACFNCAVFGTLMLMAVQRFSLAQSLGYGLGTGIGFTAALCLVDEAKHQLKRCAVPSSFRGMPVLLLYLGLVSLAIYGLTGHPLPQ